MSYHALGSWLDDPLAQLGEGAGDVIGTIGKGAGRLVGGFAGGVVKSLVPWWAWVGAGLYGVVKLLPLLKELKPVATKFGKYKKPLAIVGLAVSGIGVGVYLLNKRRANAKEFLVKQGLINPDGTFTKLGIEKYKQDPTDAVAKQFLIEQGLINPDGTFK